MTSAAKVNTLLKYFSTLRTVNTNETTINPRPAWFRGI